MDIENIPSLDYDEYEARNSMVAHTKFFSDVSWMFQVIKDEITVLKLKVHELEKQTIDGLLLDSNRDELEKLVKSILKHDIGYEE
jgi:hypothetical protein